MELHLKPGEFIVSKTDLKGIITYGNRTFIEISGYSEKELLGSPHNILRHKDMPKIVFKLLWQRIQDKQGIYAFVKNRAKHGDFYWVFVYVTASINEDGNTIGYYSVRREPNRDAIKTVEGIYELLLEAEKKGGMDASLDLLTSVLNEKGVSYDEFVLSLQK